MPSIFPAPRPHADAAATRVAFTRWLEAQEADFPLQDPADRAWRDRLVAFIETAVHPDVQVHGVPLKSPGRKGWIDFLLQVGDAYPDGITTYEAILVDGDLGAALWTYRATHRAAFGERLPTQQPLQVSGVMIDRFESGLVVEHWAIIDRLTWLQQLGAISEALDL